MNFASPFAWIGVNKEEVADEELDNDLSSNVMKEEKQEKQVEQAKAGFFSSLFKKKAAPTAPKSRLRSVAPSKPSKPRVPESFVEHVDTNVLSVKFSTLAVSADDLFAGDPTFCENCNAVLSKTSQLVKPDAGDIQLDADISGELLWKCEFCDHENKVDLEAEEIPKTDSRDYVLEPAPQADQKDNAGTVVFVVDVSGSMCVTTEVPGRLKLKGVRPPKVFNLPEEDGFMNMRVPQSNSTWISRLQCVQAAVDQQLQDWKKSDQDKGKSVGFVTFNREVTVWGDGTIDPVVITGDKLNKQQELQAAGNAINLDKPLEQTYDKFVDKLYEIEPSGATALGPAMVVAIAMASKQRGNRVVVCTDGLANVGLGALDVKEDAERQKVEEWYDAVGNLAQVFGVCVSIISIKGDECALEDLGRVAEATGGSVTRVDPLELTKDFAAALAKPIIATNVNCTLLVHSGIVIREEEQATNKVVNDVGNITEDSEISYEYGIASKAQLEKYKDLKSLPFQVQIVFTRLDGMKCLRVLSQSQQITFERQQAEQQAQFNVLAANAIRRGVNLAKQGKVAEARSHQMVWGRYMGKAAQNQQQKQQFQGYVAAAQHMDDDYLDQQNAIEMDDSDEEMDLLSEALPAPRAFLGAPASASNAPMAPPMPQQAMLQRGKASRKKEKARKARNDEAYERMNVAKNLNSDSFF